LDRLQFPQWGSNIGRGLSAKALWAGDGPSMDPLPACVLVVV